MGGSIDRYTCMHSIASFNLDLSCLEMCSTLAQPSSSGHADQMRWLFVFFSKSNLLNFDRKTIKIDSIKIQLCNFLITIFSGHADQKVIIF